MKSIFTSFLALFCAITMWAEGLSPQQALARFSADQSRHSLKTSPVKSNLKLIDTGKLGDFTAYYVFSSVEQTVILSADDVAEPVLGYLDRPAQSMDEMPPAMKWWLAEYAREIEYAATHTPIVKSINVKPNLSLGNATVVANDVFAASDRTDISPLCTSKWNQDAPYNNQCPKINGTPTYTGCMATAMAQVMNYHQWPEKGTGSITYKWANNGNQEISKNFATMTFDWGNMLDTYRSGQYNTTQSKAVATLMEACGYASQMNYGTSASGAVDGAALRGLKSYLGYDKGARLLHRDYFPLSEWNQKMYDNLKNIGPVLYCGQASDGGHAFVCDGYQTSDEKFHINWGWGGSYDGWFLLSALNPEGQGIGGYEGGYNRDQTAMVGLRKAQAGSQDSAPEVGFNRAVTLSRSGSWGLYIINNFLFNSGDQSGNFQFGYSLTSASNATTYGTVFSSGTLPPGYGYQLSAQNNPYNFSIPSTTAAGTYKLKLVYKVNNGSWQPVQTVYGTSDEFTIVIGSNGIQSIDGSSQAPVEVNLVVTSATVPSSSLKAGESAMISATIQNQGSSKVSEKVICYVCAVDEATQSASPIAAFASATVSLNAGASKSQLFRGSLPVTVAEGTYYILFVVEKDEKLAVISDPYQVTVEGSDALSLVSCSYGDATKQAGTSFDVSLVLNNKSASAVKLPAFQLVLLNSEYYLKAYAEATNLDIPANSNVTNNFTLTLPEDLPAGTYYLAFCDDYLNILFEWAAKLNITASAAIDSIDIDEAGAEAEYYNLQGVKVDGLNLQPGIYIVKQGRKVSKILVK